jgi:hypothetical protein
MPWVGIESARFGESRNELRVRLGDFSSFLRSPGDTPIDHYVPLGLLLHFDLSDRLDFIEATVSSDLSYSGVRLLGRPFGEVLEDLRVRGAEIEMDDSGCSLSGLGISLYTPAPDELEFDVEGVALCAPKAESIEAVNGAEMSDSPEPPQEDTLF